MIVLICLKGWSDERGKEKLRKRRTWQRIGSGDENLGLDARLIRVARGRVERSVGHRRLKIYVRIPFSSRRVKMAWLRNIGGRC